MNRGRRLAEQLSRSPCAGERTFRPGFHRPLSGSLLLSHLQLIATARSDQAAEKRRPFFVHVDELQNFSTESIASLLSEARKFAVHFCLANQYTTQLSDNVRAAVLGNAGSLMVFRVAPADAELLAPEFHPLPPHELSDQSPYRARLRRTDGDQRAIEVSPRLYGAQAFVSPKE